MKNTNIFKYATSELSQDAFICWLVSHATKEGWNENPVLRKCAIEFLNEILKSKNIAWNETSYVKDIKKQYKNIDVLIQIDDYHIIIEDKTFTGTHDDQINRYKKILISEGISENNIICVYYKIEEQPHPEKDVDIEFTRSTILNILCKYEHLSENSIFDDYIAYLKWIDSKVNSYQILPISEWTSWSYIGLFTHLTKTKLQNETVSWGYVSNPMGGFMGLWWSNLLSNEDLLMMGLPGLSDNEIYLQIEDNIITVKYALNENYKCDTAKVNENRWKMYNYFHNIIGNDFKKKVFRSGKYMTVGYIEYNESNYLEKLELLEKLLKDMKYIKF